MGKKVLVALRMAGIAGQDKFGGILRHLGESHDWEMTLVRTAQEFTPKCVAAALREGYDGFIVSIPETERAAALLAASDVPTVVMDIHTPSLAARKRNIVFIRNSPREIGQAAAGFLLATGRCRSYAFFHNPSVMQWSVDRFASFRETLRDRGLWCHELHEAAELRGMARPVGVLAANDDTGFSLLSYCARHRLRVPDDVLVLGIDNDALVCENCHPTLSSVQPDFEQEGFLAAQELSRMMCQRRSAARRPATLFVGVKAVVRRASTAEVSSSGKLVQKAMAFIRKNALKGIGVDDVVRHLGCSRRLADLRFRELQGGTIGETIIALRLAEVQRLLATTREPISTIGLSCGYESANHLKNLFKRRFGMSMREYRRTKSCPVAAPAFVPAVRS